MEKNQNIIVSSYSCQHIGQLKKWQAAYFRQKL